jgi:hypothetical protein
MRRRPRIAAAHHNGGNLYLNNPTTLMNLNLPRA